MIDHDLAAALRAVGSDDGADAHDVVDAGFFHRTLARWLGLPEGQGPSRAKAPVRWEYGFWKATFEPLTSSSESPDGRATYAADLFRTREGPVERVSWFVKKDTRGRIVEAGWLSAPPRLLDDAVDAAATDDVDVTLSQATLARLLDDDGA